MSFRTAREPAIFINSNYTINADDPVEFITVNNTALNTIDLPPVSLSRGRRITIKDGSNNFQLHNCVLQTTATIEGNSQYRLKISGGSWVIESDGTAWWIVSQYLSDTTTGFQILKTKLIQSQILSLHTSPLVLIQPKVNANVQIVSCFSKMVWSGAPASYNNHHVQLRDIATSIILAESTQQIHDTSGGTIQWSTTINEENFTTTNSGVEIIAMTPNNNPTGGNGNLHLDITYRYVDLITNY
ncbi:hypothetical protein EBZ39_05260 [bacterium]|nr:hypothetical protein [bacterium]